MRKLRSFNFITLNGLFEGPQGDISWHKDENPEKNEYANEGLQGESVLLFGRKTYDMMVSFWPTPMAEQFDPVMAKGMNNAEKIVFSTSLKKATWNNTQVIGGNIKEEVTKLKNQPGKDLTILGSGSIITQFSEWRLIDEYQFMIDPVAIGDGTPAFKGLKNRLELRLIDSKIFKSGVVVLTYKPA